MEWLAVDKEEDGATVASQSPSFHLSNANFMASFWRRKLGINTKEKLAGALRMNL
ncbi:MAG: hypothetical protein LBJ37_22090 [Paucimonas sp.]|jgi:hypothetical protein|nr:hypothetical protein [Paucimonas sp.]